MLAAQCAEESRTGDVTNEQPLCTHMIREPSSSPSFLGLCCGVGLGSCQLNPLSYIPPTCNFPSNPSFKAKIKRSASLNRLLVAVMSPSNSQPQPSEGMELKQQNQAQQPVQMDQPRVHQGMGKFFLASSGAVLSTAFTDAHSQ